MRSASKLGLLACLYLSQGLPYGFFTQGLPALLRQRGMSVEKIGLMSLLFLPWALKFLWAPLIDRFGRRKTWIVPLQLASAAALVGLSFFDPSNGLKIVLAGVALISLLSATQDIATDALAVDLLSPAERGSGNGVQVGAYYLGMIIGGGVLLIWLDRLGWRTAFQLMAGLMVLATLPILLRKEPIRTPSAASHQPFPLRDFFRREGVGRHVAMLIVFKCFDALVGPMVKPMFIDLGLTIGEIGAIVGTAGAGAGLSGALFGGFMVSRLGRRRALLIFGGLQIAAIALYVLPASGLSARPMLYAIVGADAFFGAAATTALFTVMMDACRPATAGSDYTIQACVVVLSTGAAGALSGVLAHQLGFAGHFALATLASAAGLLVVARLTHSNLPLEVTP